MQYAHTDDALALSHAGRGWRAAECTLMRAVRLLLRGVPSGPRSGVNEGSGDAPRVTRHNPFISSTQYTIQQHNPKPRLPRSTPH